MYNAGLLYLFVAAQATSDPVFSGPQPGELVSPFQMTNGVGKDAGKELTVAKEQTGAVTIVFVHELNRPAFGLSNAVMRLVSDRRSKMTGAVVYLDNDPTRALDRMKNSLSKYIPHGIDAGVFVDGVEGPEAYGLNRNVAVTVLIVKDRMVAANFALVQPSLEADAPKIFKAIGDVLGEETPPKVADYSESGNMQSRKMDTARKPTAKPLDSALRSLLSPLLRAKSKEDVTAAAGKIETHAGENPKTRTQIGDIARRIIAGGKLSNYGTADCQAYLTKWAEEFKPSEAGTEKSDASDTSL